MATTDEILAKAYSNPSNARRAAKKADLEPCEFSVKPDGTGKYKIVLRTVAAVDPATTDHGATDLPDGDPEAPGVAFVPEDECLEPKLAEKPEKIEPAAAEALAAQVDAAGTATVTHDVGAALALLSERAASLDEFIQGATITSSSGTTELKEKARKLFGADHPRQTLIDALKAAQGGTLPPEPVMEAKPYLADAKKWLPKLREAIAGGGVNALKHYAEELKPTYTARKILRQYTILAIAALEAKEAQGAAAVE